MPAARPKPAKSASAVDGQLFKIAPAIAVQSPAAVTTGFSPLCFLGRICTAMTASLGPQYLCRSASEVPERPAFVEASTSLIKSSVSPRDDGDPSVAGALVPTMLSSLHKSGRR